MKRFNKLISLILAVLFCFSAFNITALAGDKTMAEEYSSCPALSLDCPYSMDYDAESTDEDEGVVTFTPAATGDYYFYSLGEFDTMATLYNGITGEELAKNDDYFATNFVIKAHLEAGTTYVLKTGESTYEHESKINFTVSISSSLIVQMLLDQFKQVDLTGQTIEFSFVIDTTGSMWDEIQSVKKQLQGFVDTIGETNATLRINLIDYQDITHDGMNSTTIHKSSKNSVWYEYADSAELKEEIGDISLGDGGDFAETAIDALGYLVQDDDIKYSEDSTRFAFLITDATSKTNNRHGIKDMEELAKLLKDKGVTASVVTDKDYFDSYAALTEGTGGKAYNIDDENFGEALSVIAADVIAETAEQTSSPSILSILRILFGLNIRIPVGKISPYAVVTYPFNIALNSLTYEIDDTAIAEISTTDGKLVIEGKKNGTTRVVIKMNGAYIAGFDLIVSDTVEYGNTLESCAIGTLISKMQYGASTMKNFVFYNEAKADFKLSAIQQTSILTSLKGTDKSFTVVNDDEKGEAESSWTFNGADVSMFAAGLKELKTEIGINKDSSPAKAIAAATFKKFATYDFNYSGNLPCKANIEAAATGIANGTYTLYHYNPTTGALEDEGAKADVKDGRASFPITHCSTYVLGESAEAPAPSTEAPAATPAAVKTNTVKLTLKKVTVKKNAKKVTLQAVLKVNGKVAKNKKVTFKFNGKKYTVKTNKKGVAKVIIKKSVLKKLKKGKKITYSVTYGKKTVKKTVKVK